MKRANSNPVLAAGLGGASLAIAPRLAYGLPLQGAADRFFASPLAPFMVGILGGAAVASGIYCIVARLGGAADRLDPAGEPLGRHSTRAAHAAGVPVAASLHKPRHMNPADFEKSGVIRVQPASGYAEMQKGDAPADKGGRHLKPTIMERLGIDMMSGVPIIERADGSVGDVGTGWWIRGVGEKAIISDSGFGDERPVDAFLYEKNRPTPQAITQRVAQIDEGMYPEQRTSDDLDRSDMWTSALQALDEKIGVAPEKVSFTAPAFLDVIGGGDTIDEPDGLADKTGFILFKIPAGHPEVTDTESYINHLLSDEFSRSSSPSIRMSSHRFMRVIEGGTHGMRTAGRTGRQKGTYAGKHFAPLAAQA